MGELGALGVSGAIKNEGVSLTGIALPLPWAGISFTIIFGLIWTFRWSAFTISAYVVGVLWVSLGAGGDASSLLCAEVGTNAVFNVLDSSGARCGILFRSGVTLGGAN